jgi:hypothetical protein
MAEAGSGRSPEDKVDTEERMQALAARLSADGLGAKVHLTSDVFDITATQRTSRPSGWEKYTRALPHLGSRGPRMRARISFGC